MRRLRDPFAGSVFVLALMAVAGIVAIALGYRGIAATDDISIQIPFAVSGGLGGLGLLAFSGGLIGVQMRRKHAARERAEVERLIERLGG